MLFNFSGFESNTPRTVRYNASWNDKWDYNHLEEYLEKNYLSFLMHLYKSSRISKGRSWRIFVTKPFLSKTCHGIGTL